MASTYFELTDGAVTVGISIVELANGTLEFQLDVLNDSGTIGDLNGLFFDIGNEALLDGLTITGDDVTDSAIKIDGVSKVDGYNNVNGEVVNTYDKFDAGIQFGTSGMAQDDIQSTSFVLSHDNAAVTLNDFLAQDFAVRLTSVGEIDGSRNDSTKIGGTSPDTPDETDPVHIANNDSMVVFEDEEFNADGVWDDLEGPDQTLLDNDLTDAGDYTGQVLAANGSAFQTETYVVGSHGGVLKVTADGEVDFSADGDFDYLTNDESASTQFTYEIEGGDMATLDVLVFARPDTDDDGDGEDDDPPPPPGDDDEPIFDDGPFEDGAMDDYSPVPEDDALLF